MERGERNREAAPKLVIMLIRMICGWPQTDEEKKGRREEGAKERREERKEEARQKMESTGWRSTSGTGGGGKEGREG